MRFKMSGTNLLPDLLAIGTLIDLQPADVRELFQYALAMVMVETGKAHILERHATDVGEVYTHSTADGQMISIPKPRVRDEYIERLMEAVRENIAEDDGDK